MGIRTAMVDRARIVRKELTGTRTMGTSPVVPTHGAWFKCRLDVPFGDEDAAEQGIGAGRRSAMKRPTVMYDVQDENGDPVVLSFTDELEVESAQLGRAQWRVTTTPRPIRKKRTVIGYETRLARVVERQNRSLVPIEAQEA